MTSSARLAEIRAKTQSWGAVPKEEIVWLLDELDRREERIVQLERMIGIPRPRAFFTEESK